MYRYLLCCVTVMQDHFGPKLCSTIQFIAFLISYLLTQAKLCAQIFPEAKAIHDNNIFVFQFIVFLSTFVKSSTTDLTPPDVRTPECPLVVFSSSWTPKKTKTPYDTRVCQICHFILMLQPGTTVFSHSPQIVFLKMQQQKNSE